MVEPTFFETTPDDFCKKYCQFISMICNVKGMPMPMWREDGMFMDAHLNHDGVMQVKTNIHGVFLRVYPASVPPPDVCPGFIGAFRFHEKTFLWFSVTGSEVVVEDIVL